MSRPLRTAGAHVTRAAQVAHAATGLPREPSWAGYWTFVTASIIVMFILFTARKGTLGKWLGFLSWSNPAPLGSATGDQSATNPQLAPAASAANPNPGVFGGSNPVGAGTANPTTGFGALPEISGIWANIIGTLTGKGKTVQ